MCSVTFDEEDIKKELDDNRCKLIDSVDRAEVLLRCLKKLIIDTEEDKDDHTSRKIQNVAKQKRN